MKVTTKTATKREDERITLNTTTGSRGALRQISDSSRRCELLTWGWMDGPPNVLLIEDDSSLAANLRLVLEDAGLAVAHCTRGDDGLRRTGATTFDVVSEFETDPIATLLLACLAEQLA